MTKPSLYPDQLLAVIEAPDEATKGALLAAIEPPPDGSVWQIPSVPTEPQREPGVLSGRSTKRRQGIDNHHGRRRFLHAIWHIEITAIDLCCLLCLRAPGQPQAFHADHLGIARDEAIHAGLLRTWLIANDYPPGSEPIHHRLWQSASAADDVGEQLVVVPRFLEARGLDVSAELLPRMAAADPSAHQVVERIYHDEIRHVSIGTEWHRRWCAQHSIDPADHFKQVCDKYFAKQIPGPITLDRNGRTTAGFWPEELDYLEGQETETESQT